MRAVNRLLSGLLGLLLVVVGAAAAVEVVVVGGLGHAPWLLPLRRWYHTLTTTRLDAGAVQVVSACVGVLGVLLLVAELWPRRPVRLPIEATGPGEATWWVMRAATERRLAERLADRLDAPARVRLGNRHGWLVRVAVRAEDDRHDEVERAVRAELADLTAPADAQVRLRLLPPRAAAPAPRVR